MKVTTGVYHLTKQPELWHELKRQLQAAIPADITQPDVTELEKVPLMEAVAKESLRYGCPIRGRNPRIVPEGGMVCGGINIPQGVGCPLPQDSIPSSHTHRGVVAHTNYRLAFSAPSGITAPIQVSTRNPSCSSRSVG